MDFGELLCLADYTSHYSSSSTSPSSIHSTTKVLALISQGCADELNKPAWSKPLHYSSNQSFGSVLILGSFPPLCQRQQMLLSTLISHYIHVSTVPPAHPLVNITCSECIALKNDYLLTPPLMGMLYMTEGLVTYSNVL